MTETTNNMSKEDEKKDSPVYLGQKLLSYGFEVWFLYMFKLLEGREFIVEEIHEDLFQFFEDIHDRNILRGILNLPPRSAKTTLGQYFIAYSLAINPRCNFIYTSYSQPLLTDISLKIISIIQSPHYSAMYSLEVKEEEEELSAVDDFWKDIAIQKSKGKKNTYSAKKWTTPAGGTCLFSSMGSSIIGFGAGIRGADKFSGMIIVDDGDKPSDVWSQVMRDKTHEYFDGTILTRLNDSNVALLNNQQRLHMEDLTGYILDTYEDYDVMKKPLVDNLGRCLLPNQYTEKRLIELQKNQPRWSAQYQQEPVLLGGMFGLPCYHKGDSDDIFDGIVHVDAGFSGSDSTALTIFKQVGDRFIGYGRLWNSHIDDIKSEVYADVVRFRGGTMHFEDNADKGFVAKAFQDLGALVEDYHESRNKHVKIMLYAKEGWGEIDWIEETDPDYIKQCLNYTEKATHDDAPDSCASLLCIYKEDYRDWDTLLK